MLTKPVLKKYLQPNSKFTSEQLLQFERYITLRVEYRDKEKQLKSSLKKKISPLISEEYKRLIGVIERELYEGFYDMTQVNVKYKKGVPKSNYMDYLSVAELRGLNVLKECMIESLNKYNDLGIESACKLANRVGREVRKWFVDKYNIRPEDLPADEVSYAVCKSSIKKFDEIKKLNNRPQANLTYENANGQVTMNLDLMQKNQGNDR